jgi:hypothetical protein
MERGYSRHPTAIVAWARNGVAGSQALKLNEQAIVAGRSQKLICGDKTALSVFAPQITRGPAEERADRSKLKFL